MAKLRPIYISATKQDTGKTSVIMGLIQTLIKNKKKPGYIKPVGQRYVRYKRSEIDEDAVLVHQVFKLKEKPRCLNPVAVKEGFTRQFIFNPDVAPLEKKILECTKKLEQIYDIMIIEGTGHAGVGSCFNLSNARVAELLGAKAIIIAPGGIGKPIDEITLNMALFQKHNVEIIGVILNKVLPEKYDKIKVTVAQGLENQGTRLLGCLLYTSPSPRDLSTSRMPSSA